MALKRRKITSYIYLDILIPWGGYFLIQFLIKSAFQQDLYESIIVFAFPLILCLIRAEATNRILERKQVKSLTKAKFILFQIFLALSLIFLMIFEFLASMIRFGENEPDCVRNTCIGLYFLYLFFMLVSEKIYRSNTQNYIS